jgi:AraC-like DNA-binding protein
MAQDTILAAFTQMLLRVGEMLDVDRALLLDGAGLTEKDVEDPDGRVPLENQVKIWEGISRHSDVPVGLMLGQNASPEMFGVVGHACKQQRTVGEALDFLWRFRRLVGGPLIGTFRVEDGRALMHKVIPLQYVHVHHFGVSFCASTWSFLKQFGAERYAPRLVRLQCPAPPYAALLDGHFGCPIEYCADETAIAFDAPVLDHKLPAVDRGLLAYLEKHAEALQRALPRAGDDLVERARRALMEELRGGEPSADRIARKLAISKRTLQRRLQELGVDFTELLDSARKDLALLYLREPTLAAYEIAYLLGYTPSAFFRAFKRWTGRTPREMRAA